MHIRFSTIVITIIFLWLWACEEFNPWALIAFYFYMVIRSAGYWAREELRKDSEWRWKQSFQPIKDEMEYKRSREYELKCKVGGLRSLLENKNYANCKNIRDELAEAEKELAELEAGKVH